MRRASLTLMVIVLFLTSRSSNAFGQHVLDSTNFHIEWSDVVPGDPEQIDVLQWKGGWSVGLSFSGACNFLWPEYFGNALVPPDPMRSLVGSGTTGSWTPGADGLSATIKSIATGCDYSLNVPVATKYRLFSNDQCAENHILVGRVFGFGTTPFTYDFRPYVPRLYPRDQFWQVLHPDSTHSVLAVENANDCESGCQISNWDGTWFATHDPNKFRGVIVYRRASSFAVNLWVDLDGSSWSNSSSVLLLQPAGGFTGSVTEVEGLCFYDATNWSQQQQEHLQLPVGCQQPPN
jgi:hypothetical protein